MDQSPSLKRGVLIPNLRSATTMTHKNTQQLFRRLGREKIGDSRCGGFLSTKKIQKIKSKNSY